MLLDIWLCGLSEHGDVPQRGAGGDPERAEPGAAERVAARGRRLRLPGRQQRGQGHQQPRHSADTMYPYSTLHYTLF